MIKGLDKFRAHFEQNRDAFVLIGGVACHEWLASQGLPFRVTKDIDLVLIIEALDQSFVERLWAFIEAGNYEIREKAGNRELYRFSKPRDDTYPAMIEIFSRKPGGIDLAEGQRVVPIAIDEGSASLSAILLDDAYYSLILNHRTQDGDLPRVKPAALVPLKARAWLDLTKREKEGQKIDAKDIAKHRADVFRIAATLPGEPVTSPRMGLTTAFGFILRIRRFVTAVFATPTSRGPVPTSLFKFVSSTTSGSMTTKLDTPK